VIRAHVNAVKALIEGDVQMVGAVYVGGAPPPPPDRYVVLYPDSGLPEDTGLDLDADQVEMLLQATYVGTTVEQALWVAERVRARLVNATPTVAGRVCWPLSIQVSQPLRRDDDVTPPLYFAVDVYELRSIPA
jgi:hypothetical protein